MRGEAIVLNPRIKRQYQILSPKNDDSRHRLVTDFAPIPPYSKRVRVRVLRAQKFLPGVEHN